MTYPFEHLAREHPELQAFVQGAAERFFQGDAAAFDEATAAAEAVGLTVSFHGLQGNPRAVLAEPLEVARARERSAKASERAARERRRRPIMRELHGSLGDFPTGWSTRPNGLLFEGDEGFAVIAVDPMEPPPGQPLPAGAEAWPAAITVGCTSKTLPRDFGGEPAPPRTMKAGVHFNLMLGRRVILVVDQAAATAHLSATSPVGGGDLVWIGGLFNHLRADVEELATNRGLLNHLTSAPGPYWIAETFLRRELVLLRSLVGIDYADLLEEDRTAEARAREQARSRGETLHLERTKDYPQFWPHDHFVAFVANLAPHTPAR